MSKNTPRRAPEPPVLWPPAPLGRPPAPSPPPRRRTLLKSARFDAALGVPLGIAAGVLPALVVGLYLTSCDKRWLVGSGVAALVNLAISLAVGRRFWAFGAGMGAASLITALALAGWGWQHMAGWCGQGLSGGDGSEQGVGE